MAGVVSEERSLGVVVFEVGLLSAYDRREQRWLGNEHVSGIYQGPHLPEEKGEQQGTDMAAVDIGIAQQDDLVVADLLEVEVVSEAGPYRLD